MKSLDKVKALRTRLDQIALEKQKLDEERKKVKDDIQACLLEEHLEWVKYNLADLEEEEGEDWIECGLLVTKDQLAQFSDTKYARVPVTAIIKVSTIDIVNEDTDLEKVQWEKPDWRNAEFTSTESSPLKEIIQELELDEVFWNKRLWTLGEPSELLPGDCCDAYSSYSVREYKLDLYYLYPIK